MKICIVLPPWIKGGLRTVVRHIVIGLLKEGYKVKVINLKNKALIKAFLKEVKIAIKTHLDKDMPDVILYMGSVPLPGHILYKVSSVPLFLFIHGYTRHQLINMFKSSHRLREMMGATLLLLELDFSRIFKTIDFYIAHSETVHEMCAIPIPRRILLPQFMFQEEIDRLYELGNEIRGKDNINAFNKEELTIIAYTSFAYSPRLLSTHNLIALGKLCAKQTNKRIKLLIIDPHSKPLETSYVRIMNYLPRKDFLKRVATSVLYIDGCIDEEIRYSALEALALGTPVAKILHTKYQSRCDYSSRELIIANSFSDLVKKLVDYINYLDDFYSIYSRAGFNFIKTKRVWDNVKKELIKFLSRV